MKEGPARQLAIRIMGEFEGALARCGLKAPQATGKRRGATARLYRGGYYELEDAITDILLGIKWPRRKRRR
jgi:hypothetical protein